MLITDTSTNFVREPLSAPMGFKGSYLSELWQVAVRLSTQSHTGIGVGVQSVLWSDASVFASASQAAGNAWMFSMTAHALALAKGLDFSDPFSLLNTLLPQVHEYGKKITGNPNLRKTFALNSLVAVDHAAWQLYASVKGITELTDLIPESFRPALQGRQEALCSIPLITYGMAPDEARNMAEKGHFLLKIKIGADPDKDGSQEKMLAWDIARLEKIHAALKDLTTPYTDSGRILYYLDANGRYDSKERLLQLLDRADAIGALERIVILEEPFPEEHLVDVSALPVRIAADESAHSDADAIQRIDMGYTAIALKPIAKTMSMTLRVLQEAHKRNIPCFCADLTVNPWMVDINKSIAARIAPLPGIKIGVLESNGPQNYANWSAMKTQHPLYVPQKELDPQNGLFPLNEEFYRCTGGMFSKAKYYANLV